MKTTISEVEVTLIIEHVENVHLPEALKWLDHKVLLAGYDLFEKTPYDACKIIGHVINELP